MHTHLYFLFCLFVCPSICSFKCLQCLCVSVFVCPSFWGPHLYVSVPVCLSVCMSQWSFVKVSVHHFPVPECCSDYITQCLYIEVSMCLRSCVPVSIYPSAYVSQYLCITVSSNSNVYKSQYLSLLNCALVSVNWNYCVSVSVIFQCLCISQYPYIFQYLYIAAPLYSNAWMS